MSHANTPETLLARQDILDVLARYARGVDRADGPLLHSCYHDDAIEEHGSSYSGPARAYVDGAMERMARLSHPMAHYLASSHIEFDPGMTTAHVETYVLTFARFEDKSGTPQDTLTGGRLFDRFEKRGGEKHGVEWRIAHRRMAFDWNRDMPVSEGWCLGLFNPADPRMVMGRRGAGDLTYSRP